MDSATCGLLVDITYMCLNKEAKYIHTKIIHCPSAWWYWHWVEKGYTQGTIASLLNSFESDAANIAHDSTYNPQSMTVTSMFAGDVENQWLDQVEEELESDLSNHDKDNIGVSGTTVRVFLASGYGWVTVMHEKPISSAHPLTSLPYPRAQ
jgi:hypothetical protein